MWSFVADRAGIELDLFMANASAASRGPVHGRLAAAAMFVPAPGATVALLDAPPPHAPADVHVERLANGSPLGEWDAADALLRSGTLDRLRRLERPIRLGAQQWTDAMVEVAERLSAEGLALDASTRPTVTGGTVGYWNTKIGTDELLARIPSVAPHVPRSTIVADLADAVAVADSLAWPSVLKPDEAAGGAGIVALSPGRTPQPDELRRRLRAASRRAKRKATAFDGPFLLQERVGSDGALSPTLDFWIEEDHWACIALAEQILDGGFGYAGACFPGRLEPGIAAQCTALGGDVAEHLRTLGYRGLLNVDFVVDGAQVWLMELNVRQSAPLDQSLRMTAEHGPSWRDTHGFRLLEQDGTLEPSR